MTLAAASLILLSFALLAITLRNAIEVRTAFEGVATPVVLRALVGLAPASRAQRRALTKGYLSLLLYVLSIVVPVAVLRNGGQASGPVPSLPEFEGTIADVMSSGVLRPVELRPGEFGVELERLVPGGFLDAAGFRSGDIVVAVDGGRARSAADAFEAMSRITQRSTARVLRAGSSGVQREIILELAERPDDHRPLLEAR